MKTSRILCTFALLALGPLKVLWAQSTPKKADAAPIAAGGSYGSLLKVSDKAPLEYDAKKQGEFIVALAQDQRGSIWVGTEDKGVWCYTSSAMPGKKWRQYTTKDGLGDDNAYAITTDRMGRVWVGHVNHGVSVWNGRQWRNYGVLDGPLGERVFALAVSPLDGDVWIAHSAGLTRYSLQRDAWLHYTRAAGLPSHLLTALAFDDFGTLYVGTQCDGIGISHSDSDYRDWQTVRGPDELPDTHSGAGLPGNMINDLLWGRDEVLYAATTRGLARSRDRGETWSYIRGSDWKAKLKGKLPAVPPRETELKSELLREDYISTLARDENGLLWIGYRQYGYEARRPENDRALYSAGSDLKRKFPYVSAFLLRPGQPPLFANYGEGLKQGVQLIGNASAAERESAPQSTLNGARPTALPAPAKALSLAEWNAVLGEVERVKPEAGEAAFAVALDDDWTTRGDWLGRRGLYWANLCAILSPYDYVWGASPQQIQYFSRIGPNADKGDGLRYWVHWLYTDNPRSLEMPAIYFDSRLKRKHTGDLKKLRRQAEIDDHGEAYPMTKDGPHLYMNLQVPRGLFFLSLYDFNKDGHTNNNRIRDYRLSIRPQKAGAPMSSIANFHSSPEWSNGRIRDFWGGVWKRFLVRGPQTLTIEVNRNYSYNTILAGVFLDRLTEKPAPYFQTVGQQAAQEDADERERRKLVEARQSQAPNFVAATTEDEAATRLWAALENTKLLNPAWWAQEGRRFYLPLLRYNTARLRQSIAEEMPATVRRMATNLYHLQMFSEWETYLKRQKLTTAREIEKSLRWDGASSYPGKGYATITQLLDTPRASPQP